MQAHQIIQEFGFITFAQAARFCPPEFMTPRHIPSQNHDEGEDGMADAMPTYCTLSNTCPCSLHGALCCELTNAEPGGVM